MSGMPFSMADVVALLFVVAVVALALRSVVKGGALDCSTCNGDCGGCGGVCKNPKLKLSKERLAQLDEIDRMYEVSK